MSSVGGNEVYIFFKQNLEYKIVCVCVCVYVHMVGGLNIRRKGMRQTGRDGFVLESFGKSSNDPNENIKEGSNL